MPSNSKTDQECIRIPSEPEIIVEHFSGPPLTARKLAVPAFRDIHATVTAEKVREALDSKVSFFPSTAKGVSRRFRKGEFDKTSDLNIAPITSRVVIDEDDAIVGNEYILQLYEALDLGPIPYSRLRLRARGKVSQRAKAIVSAAIEIESGILSRMDEVQLVGLLNKKWAVDVEILRVIWTPKGAERLTAASEIRKLLEMHRLMSDNAEVVLEQFPTGKAPPLAARLEFLVGNRAIRDTFQFPEMEKFWLRQATITAANGEKRFQDKLRRFLRHPKLASDILSGKAGYYETQQEYQRQFLDSDDKTHPLPHLQISLEKFDHPLSKAFISGNLKRHPRGPLTEAVARIVSRLIDLGGAKAVAPIIEIIQMRLGDVLEIKTKGLHLAKGR